MSDDLDVDDIADREDLVDVLQLLQKRVSDLEGKVEALHNARRYLLDEVEDLKAENEELRQQIQDVGGHVELVDQTMASPKKGELDKILAILDYAYSEGTGGPAGKKISSKEAAAAAGCSRDTALRLISTVATRFDWASEESPGGPNPNNLLIKTASYDLPDLKDAVTDEYAQGESTG